MLWSRPLGAKRLGARPLCALVRPPAGLSFLHPTHSRLLPEDDCYLPGGMCLELRSPSTQSLYEQFLKNGDFSYKGEKRPGRRVNVTMKLHGKVLVQSGVNQEIGFVNGIFIFPELNFLFQRIGLLKMEVTLYFLSACHGGL